MSDALTRRYQAHTLRLLSFLAIKAHDPHWTFDEQYVLELTRVAHELAQECEAAGAAAARAVAAQTGEPGEGRTSQEREPLKEKP